MEVTFVAIELQINKNLGKNVLNPILTHQLIAEFFSKYRNIFKEKPDESSYDLATVAKC